MKLQAAVSIARKKKTGAKSARAAVKKLKGKTRNSIGVRKIIKQEAEASNLHPQKKSARSTQSQTHRRKKGTLQSPAPSRARHLKNIESGQASSR